MLKQSTTAVFALCLVAFIVGMTIPSAYAIDRSPGDTLFDRGLRAFQLGAFDQAAASWQGAANAYEHERRSLDQSRALAHLAQAYQALGQLMKSLQTLDLALALAQTSNDPVWTASIFDSLGRGYLAAGKLEAAGHYLDQALFLARPLARPDLTAIVLNDTAMLQAAERHYVEAMDAATESAELAEIGGLPSLAARARINSAWASLQLGHYSDCRTRLDKASEQLRSLPASHDKAFDLINLGLAYQELRTHIAEASEPLRKLAEQAFQDAIQIAGDIHDARAQSYALGHLGHVAEVEGHFSDALEITRRAVLAAQLAEAPESLYQWKWQTGRLLRAMGRQEEAISAYRSAAMTLQPIRQELAWGPAAAAGPARTPPRNLLLEYADLLLQQSVVKGDRTSAQPYLLAARDAIELFKAAEVRDYFGDECVDQLRSRITTLDQVSRSTAVVYPIVLPDRTELLISSATGLTRISIPVSSDVLTAQVRLFRKALEKRTTLEYLPLAQQLYDWLIRPMEPGFAAQSLDTLVFVPDGPLRTIPLAALHDGKQFLITKYAVATTPGLTLTDPQPLAKAKQRMLSSGLTLPVQGFPPLPNVSAELQMIRSLYGGDQLVDQDFVVSRLERELKEGPFTILHIASHGRFSSDVNNSFLLTFDSKLTMSRLHQLIGVFRYRQNPLELLTLSACQTAVGDDRAALGLAGVAIKAGARSALATLWFINDEASTKLVSEFYRQLHDSPVSKAIALQRAQMTLLNDAVYQHPAYWSPFLLLNNWL
jgi:CHAT domain-containing protein